MKRMIRMITMALMLSLALGGVALAQDDTVPPQGGKGQNLMKTTDANSDGKISKEEFMEAARKRAEARFQKLDANGDGYITQDELDAAKAKRGERAAKRAAKAPQ